jgi:hypothetical protein
MGHLGMIMTLGAAAFSSTPASDWHSSYGAALKEVRRVDRPLFIAFGGKSTPIGKTVSAEPVFDQKIVRLLKADYVRLYVDTESHPGKRLATRFKANTVPFLVVIDRSAARQVYRQPGPHSVDQVAQLLVKYRRVRREQPPVLRLRTSLRYDWLIDRPISSFGFCPT